MALETFGSIIKEEKLRTSKDGIIPNTLVLETQIPFPGYYGATPTDKVPDSYFLIMPKKESTEKILRLTHVIKKNSNISFQGSPSKICVNNDNFHGIRIRGLKDYKQLAEIQNYYRDNGINFRKIKEIDSPAIIQIKKIFSLEDFSDEILKDVHDHSYYLKINKQLNWSSFRTITLKIKNNSNSADYDAALAVIYGEEVLDTIRIYCKDITLPQLQEIHEKYNELIRKAI